MKNDKKIIIGKNFGNELIKQLYREKEIISVTIVGSFTKNYNLDKIGDLDIVVICKKITNNLINSRQNIVCTLFHPPLNSSKILGGIFAENGEILDLFESK